MAKKTLQELKEERKALQERNSEIYAAVEAEKRAITDAELAEVQSNIIKRAKLAEEITDLMSELNDDPKTEKRGTFNFVKAIGEARQTNSMAFEIGEQRVLITSNDYKQSVVEVNIYPIMDAIREQLVLTRAGATMLTGLQGDLRLPRVTGIKASWSDEGAEATEGVEFDYFSSQVMGAKRIATYVDITNKLLEQSSQDINALIQRDIVRAVSSAIQDAALGGGTRTSAKPGGIFNGVGAAVELSFADIVDLESNVASANSLSDTACYIMHPKAYGMCKLTPKATNTGLGMIADGDMVNGYKTLRTTGIYTKDESGTPTYGVAFGDFSEMFIGQWGNITVKVDPYTQATKGVTRLHVEAYVDVVVRNKSAISVAMFK